MRDIVDALLNTPTERSYDSVGRPYDYPKHIPIEAANELIHARERLQAIIDWCDIAMKNADEFDSHGVRNLDGPVFDAAREYLDKVRASKNGR